MISYVICTTIALVLGLVLATIIIGIIMSTKLYTKIAMKITKNVLLSDEYGEIAKEFVKKTTDIAVDTASEVKSRDWNIHIENL